MLFGLSSLDVRSLEAVCEEFFYKVRFLIIRRLFRWLIEEFVYCRFENDRYLI